jgi:hypothetical protein
MKTKVLVDNKSRIRKGLEPIQPAVTIAQFSITQLSDAEREEVITAIRAFVSEQERKRQSRKKKAQD